MKAMRLYTFFRLCRATALCLLCLFGKNDSCAQVMKRQVQVNTYKRLTFHQGPQRLNMRQMVQLVKKHPEAYELMTTAKGHYDLRNYCRLAGSIMVILPVISYARGDAPLWAVLGVGVALWGISFPLHSAYERRALEGAHMYNLTVPPMYTRTKGQVVLGIQAFSTPGLSTVPALQVRFGL